MKTLHLELKFIFAEIFQEEQFKLILKKYKTIFLNFHVENQISLQQMIL